MRRWDVIVASLLFSAVFAWFALGLFGSFLEQRRAAARYVPAEATIMDAQVVAQPTSWEGSGTWDVSVRYRYTRDGRRYESTREVFYGDTSFDDFDEATAAAAQYVTGAALPIFLDPQDPGRVIRDPAPPPSSVPLLAVSALLLASLALLFWGASGRMPFARDRG